MTSLASGGPGSLPPGLLAALPLLALAAWAARRRAWVALGWVLVAVAVSAAVLTSRVAVSSPVGEGVAAGEQGALAQLVADAAEGGQGVAVELLGLAGTTYGLVRAIRAERQARFEAETVREISDFMFEMFATEVIGCTLKNVAAVCRADFTGSAGDWAAKAALDSSSSTSPTSTKACTI